MNVKFYEKFLSKFSQRPFNPEETLQWLSIDKSIIMSWGFQKPKTLVKDNEKTGLIFKVNGHHHKGYVLITLAWNDTYTVRFFNYNYKECKDKITQVYCDELQEKIDKIVEYVNCYKK